MSRELKVKEFMDAMKQEAGCSLNVPLLVLRERLITEEYDELKESISLAQNYLLKGVPVPVEVRAHLLKELTDLQYVLSGFAVAFGLPLEQAFDLVHQSNLSKLGADGKPIYREDGKVLKGPNYQPPDLTGLVQKYED